MKNAIHMAEPSRGAALGEQVLDRDALDPRLEAEARRRVKAARRRDPLHDLQHALGRFAFDEQEARAFGEPDHEHDGEKERHRAADIEGRLPAEGRDQLGREQPADDRPAGKARIRTVNDEAAPPRGGVFHHQRDDVGERAAETDAGQEAQQHQALHVSS